ncbi:MAG: DMT family transporter [Actinomycetota bacterium]|nr:DMT family transporter [Actinomycetota bacterium]
MRESTVGTAAILLYSSPAFVVLLVWVFLKETLMALRLLALGSTFCGIFLVIGGYDPSTLEVTPFVLLTWLLSGPTYGLYSIFGKLLSRHLSPVTILSYALGIGAALLLVAALPTLRTLAGLSSGSYTLLFILAVVHTALAFGLYTAGLKRLDAGQPALVATVEPVAAGAIGVALFGEEISAPKLLGALLVLTGAALAQV